MPRAGLGRRRRRLGALRAPNDSDYVDLIIVIIVMMIMIMTMMTMTMMMMTKGAVWMPSESDATAVVISDEAVSSVMRQCHQ